MCAFAATAALRWIQYSEFQNVVASCEECGGSTVERAENGESRIF